jgi:hypothetical protein
VACLNSRDSFRAFDKEKLIKFISFYHKDFFDVGLHTLSNQLVNIIDVRASDKFSNLNGINELARVIVQTNNHRTHS